MIDMNKKFSIIKTVDLDKLSNEIDEYMMKTRETKPYIFMHIDTMEAIEKCFPLDSYAKNSHIGVSKEGTVGYWEGCKIFINNDLKFGEVEIR